MNNSATCRRISSIAIEYNGNDLGLAKLTYSQGLFSTKPKEIFEEMKLVADRNLKVNKWAFTGYISVPHDARQLSDGELTEVALEALKKMGMTAGNQALLHIHGSTKNRHIHYIVNRIQGDGRCTIKSAKCGKRFGEAVREVLKGRDIKTDVEIGKEKREMMLSQLKESIAYSNDFEELVANMDARGLRVTLSENIKDGISGMRIVRHEDINEDTLRQYRPGFTLSQITNKLKIAEIKQIFEIKKTLAAALDEGDPATLKNILEAHNLKISIRHWTVDGQKVKRAFVLPTDENKSMYFGYKELGYQLNAIAPELNSRVVDFIEDLWAASRQEAGPQEVTGDLAELLEACLASSYVGPGEEYYRKKKDSIYDSGIDY